MANTWEDVAQNAASGESNLGAGNYSSTGLLQGMTATQAGQAALDGGSSWQDVGNAAMGGQTLGASVISGQAFDPTQWGAGARDAAAAGSVTFNPTQWGSAGAAAMGGGGNFSSTGSSDINVPNINNPAGSGGSGGGGGGGGSGSPSGGGSNSSQSSNLQNRPPIYSSGSGTGTGSASGLLNNILGNGLSKLFQDKNSPVNLQSSGVNIPGLSSSGGTSGFSQDSSSFGSLLTGNTNQQQQMSQSYQPVSMGQAAQDSLASFGNGKGASGSPFQGGIGQASSASGSSGNGFAGSPPTPFQALAQGQYTQPGTNPQSSYGSPATSGAASPQGQLEGPQGSMSNPASGLPGQPGSSAHGSPAASGGGSAGGQGNPASGGSGSAQDQGRAAMKTFVDPTNPDIKINVNAAGDQSPPKTFVDPTNPNIKITTGSAGNTYGGLNPTGAPVGGIVDNAGSETQAMFKAVNQGLKNTGLNVMNTLAYPFQNQATRDAVNKQMAKDNNQTAMDTKDHPAIYAVGRTAGEIAPWLAAQAATGGSSLLARLGIGAAVNGAYGLSQPGTGTDKLVHGAEGAITGAAFNAAGPIASKVGLPIVSAAAGAYTGYKSGHGILDTAYKTIGGAALGWGAGEGAKYGASKTGLTGYITNLLGIGGKESVKAAEAVAPATHASRPMPSAPPGEFSIYPEHQSGANAAFLQDEINNAQHMKSMRDAPTGGVTSAAPSVASAEPGLLSAAGDTARNAAALTTTGMLTRPADQATDGPSKPLDQFNAFVTPKSFPLSIQAHTNTPMKEQIPPVMAKGIVNSSKDLQAQTTNIKLLSMAPAEFDKFVDSNEGRADLLDKAYKYGGVKGMKDVKALLDARDNIPTYAKTDEQPKTLAEALQMRGRQVQAVQNRAAFEKEMGIGPGFLKGTPMVPPAGAPQSPVAAQPQAQAGGGTGEIQNGPPNPNFRAQMNGRPGYIANDPQLTAQRTALNAQVMSLVMSYLMKSGRYQSMLRSGGLQGQAAALLNSSLNLKAMGG